MTETPQGTDPATTTTTTGANGTTFPFPGAPVDQADPGLSGAAGAPPEQEDPPKQQVAGAGDLVSYEFTDPRDGSSQTRLGVVVELLTEPREGPPDAEGRPTVVQVEFARVVELPPAGVVPADALTVL